MSSATNYSIRNIEQCIAMDTEIGKHYNDDKKRELYKYAMAKLEKRPDIVEFLSVDNLNKFPGPGIFEKVGYIPSDIVILDERVKDMCQLPFWQDFSLDGTRVKKYGKCPGYGVHFSCPPHSPDRLVQDQKDLDKSNVFFLLQSKHLPVDTLAGGAAPWQSEFLYELKQAMDKKFGKGLLIEKYAAGPCQGCYPDLCVTVKGECKFPEKKTRSMEAVGMPCAVICDDIAMLSGDDSWRLVYIQQWGTPEQNPKTYKLVWAAALNI